MAASLKGRLRVDVRTERESGGWCRHEGCRISTAPRCEWRPNSSSGPAHRGVDLTVEVGDVDVRMPRDRTGTFEPVTVPKHARRLDGLARNVILRSAKGMTTRDIQARLAEIYDTEISRETISKIRDRVATRDATLART